MTRHALPSTVGEMVQQRRIDLAAANRLPCWFSLNDSIDSQISVSLPRLKTFSLNQSIGMRFGVGTICSLITVDINSDSFDDPSGWVSIRPASPCARSPYQ
ncbi:hypothetical protein [Bradyrhizobium sp. LMG 9283]|uniref:hypothetical protein n=1 Tax=Bradyrhizobium sp. LMG 9283 TaxID=592064 RepID=UPI00388DA8E7